MEDAERKVERLEAILEELLEVLKDQQKLEMHQYFQDASLLDIELGRAAAFLKMQRVLIGDERSLFMPDRRRFVEKIGGSSAASV